MALRRNQRPAPSPQAQFGKRLVGYRTEKGYSQAAIGKLIGIHQSQVALIEAGKRPPPPLEKIALIAHELELPPFDHQTLRQAALGALEINERIRLLPREDTALEAPKCSEAWIVGPYPIEFYEADLREVIAESVLDRRAEYLYWIPESRSKAFDQFWSKLSRIVTQRGQSRADLTDKVRCILCPEHACMVQFALYDPRVPEKRKGRLALTGAADKVIRTVALKKEQSAQMYSVLSHLYAEVRQPGAKGDSGFRWYVPGSPAGKESDR